MVPQDNRDLSLLWTIADKAERVRKEFQRYATSSLLVKAHSEPYLDAL